MQFTPEVIAALETLRQACENDFERHRFDVFKRDLTTPPQVEVVDDTHQRFDGVTYRLLADRHYSNTVPLHRAVWTYYKGEIPIGNYEVHHVDTNKNNNDISNLQLLTRAEHRRAHGHGQIEKICVICGKKFLTVRLKQSCCSRSCGNKLIGQKNSLPKVKKTCPVCGKQFLPADSRNDCCSRSCAAKLRWRNLSPSNKICPICNQAFATNAPNQIYCSRVCKNRARRKH